MRILVIHKDKIYNIPPLVSVIYILRDLGHDVHLVTCGVNEQLVFEFSKRGITYEVINTASASHVLAKVMEYVRFRQYVSAVIKKAEYDYLWIEGGPTIRALGAAILSGRKYILQISELHEDAPAQLKAIGKVINGAQKVFMPEYNRTAIYQAWFKLPVRPTVLPNKPYFMPDKEVLLKLAPKYQKYVSIFEEKKIILYQGWISKINRDMTAFLKASKMLGDEYLFVMMGRDTDDSISYYKTIYPHLLHIEFIPAPEYLLLTSLSYIGIIAYNPDKLNQTYCAPNKIFEYGAYGKPMVGNDLPGLKILESMHAGKVVDQNDETEIENAFKDIISHYTEYSKDASKLYKITDNKKTIETAINSL